MFEIIRDAAKVGIGALSLSKENLKKLTDDLAEIGKLSKSEGERLFREMEKSRKEYHKCMTEFVDCTVKKAISQAGLASKAELNALRKKIAELEKAAKAKPKAKAKTAPRKSAKKA